ncbi:MAG: sugar phosphate isomerase/epimerase [Verrucomicrobiota bacterium]
MAKSKIGVIGDSFRLPLRKSVALARELGAEGISFYAATPAFSREDPREFKKYCADSGIEIASLIGELGGHGWQREDENETRIPQLKRIVDLAVDLGTPVITAHIGVVPEDGNSPRYAVMQSACREVGRYAADHGVCFGIETGPEPAATLRAFLDDLNQPGIGVNLDPANLVMVVCDDPVQAVHTLAPYIVSTHAKDGRNLQPCDPQAVYDAFAEGGFDKLVARTGQLFEETPLGQGDVLWDEYLKALRDCGYEGWLTIERETGDNPSEDVAAAIRFLSGF